MQSKAILCEMLPAYNNESVIVKHDQDVYDIVKEVTAAHKIFANDYDYIAGEFFDDDLEETCKQLFDFCKDNIAYKIETKEDQTTRSPAAILAIGNGDCKHYSGFIAGVLDAIARQTGKKINWVYRFASYEFFDPSPQHVFVVVNNKGKEIWIDPVLPAFDERKQPFFTLDKKVKTMALRRISGFADQYEIVTTNDNLRTMPTGTGILVSDPGIEISQNLQDAITTLLNAGVLDQNGNIDDVQLSNLAQLPPDDYAPILSAYNYLWEQSQATVGSIFSDIWRGVKKVVLEIPRGAYLSLVAINAFGYATKLNQAIATQDGKDRIKDLWQNKLGGDWTKLQNTIVQGATHKAILGELNTVGEYLNSIGVAPVAIPAWVAAASAIIAAITPLLKDILTKRAAAGDSVDLSYLNTTNPYQQNSITDFLKKNAVLILGAGAAIYFLFFNKKRA